jgi:hypothetical protein
MNNELNNDFKINFELTQTTIILPKPNIKILNPCPDSKAF